MRFPAWFIAALFSCLCFLPRGLAQQNAPPAAPAGRSRDFQSSAGRRITLDVVVTDKSGKPVTGLQEQDFTVLDDKQPQKIVSFQATNLSNDAGDQAADSVVQTILLIDAVNASFHSVGYERSRLQNFLQEDGGHLILPTSLVLMSDTSQGQSEITRNGNALVETLNSNKSGLRIIDRAQGFYGGGERVQISLDTLEKLAAHLATLPGRKLLIWISPGWPLLSGPGVELTAKNQEWIFQTIVRLSDELREARITLYNVNPLGLDESIGRTFYYEGFLKGVSSAKKTQNGNLALQVLAAQSGGLVLNSSNDLTRLITTSLTDAKAFYTISFDSPPADHPDEYHSLQIKVDKPGLTARTRTGYYAQLSKP